MTAVTPISTLSVHFPIAKGGTPVVRYLAFFVVGCAFAVGVMGMVETHHHVSSAVPQVVAYQSAH